MTEFVRINRRLFLTRLGKGTMALAVLSACGSDSGGSSTAFPASTTGPASTIASTTTAAPTETTTTAAGGLAEYLRVDLGFVSAYVVVRGSEAAVVDTGESGSEGPIEAALGTVDLGWNAVSHLILTHHHPDHVGSMPAVLNAAAAATGYIGQGDLDNVSGPRELLGLNDGDEVFGLTVIGTPGHTAGHISLLDPVASVLIAGDALNGSNGAVAGPNRQFSEDHNEASRNCGEDGRVRVRNAVFRARGTGLRGSRGARRRSGGEPVTPGCGVKAASILPA